MNVNRYLPFAFIYFFVNSVALPFGLTYTSLLAPFFYVWILMQRRRDVVLPFIAVMLPFLVVHLLFTDIVFDAYLLSLVNLLLVYVFCQAVYTFLLACDDIEKIFRWILTVNFFLCIVAVPFYFSPYYAVFWDQQVLTEGVGRLRRLRLFTYEPSYYALLFVPIFFYFLLKYFFRQNRIRGYWLLPMLLLPLLFSFSIGVIGGIILSLVLVSVIHFRRLATKRRIMNAMITSGVAIISGLVIFVIFFRNSALFIRFRNILAGRDTSGKGRTTDAFILAQKIINDGNEWWGIGLGQIKIAGEDIITDYYLYNIDIIVTLPNAAAETLAIFGWAGLALRLLVELFFFFYTRVWTNYYRLMLFCFVFIYQFTGSFVTNAAEYVIWILAFTNVFKEFDLRPESRRDS